MLVQCCLVSEKYSPYLQKNDERMKSQKGSGKAIIAAARKLLRLLTDIFYFLGKILVIKIAKFFPR
jgi:hypothetical protein